MTNPWSISFPITIFMSPILKPKQTTIKANPSKSNPMKETKIAKNLS